MKSYTQKDAVICKVSVFCFIMYQCFVSIQYIIFLYIFVHNIYI